MLFFLVEIFIFLSVLKENRINDKNDKMFISFGISIGENRFL
jgi:hypothetical protein